MKQAYIFLLPLLVPVASAQRKNWSEIVIEGFDEGSQKARYQQEQQLRMDLARINLARSLVEMERADIVFGI